jgi:hypothetical protein
MPFHDPEDSAEKLADSEPDSLRKYTVDKDSESDDDTDQWLNDMGISQNVSVSATSKK